MFLITSCIGVLFLSVLPANGEGEVKIIDRMQAEHFLQNGAVFIDNRIEAKFFLGHINGAVNLPFLWRMTHQAK